MHQCQLKCEQPNKDTPKLNMAIPRPASDKMEIESSIIFGIDTCHLEQNKTINQYEEMDDDGEE